MLPFPSVPPPFDSAKPPDMAVPPDIAPDRAICQSCTEEVLNPSSRRYRYPFAHCAHCGPRLSVGSRSYQERNGVAASFTRCASCQAEYDDPAGRHYHFETTACPDCGPQASLIRLDGGRARLDQHSVLDDVDAACSLIQRGEVVAIKGPGGYQLACDATNAAAVARLRRAKQNGARPLPLMARSLHVVASYCAISQDEELQLTSPQGPIVVLRAMGDDRLPQEVAPGLTTLGFMLPNTALHLLLLQRMSRPMVMTSGNLSEEPQIIDDAEARHKFGIAITYALIHNQPLAAGLEDSVIRVMAGRPRILRRARGFTPMPMKMPAGFERAGRLLAVGADSNAAFCLVKNGEANPSAHYGGLDGADAREDYPKTICRFRKICGHDMAAIAFDRDPDQISSDLARHYAAHEKLGVFEVQHHHAHLASCLAENRYSLNAPPVLGVTLDGHGWGMDGEFWGGEFLLANYRHCQRLATLRPVVKPEGGGRRDPWHALYAHLTGAIGWREVAAAFGELELCRHLADRRAAFEALAQRRDARRTTSCGMLIDAVAAALGLCGGGQSYEDEPAMRLEAVAEEAWRSGAGREPAWPVAFPAARGSAPPSIDLADMWRALLRDLAGGTPAPVIAARFHAWLAGTVSATARKLMRRGRHEKARYAVVALSGGCFQNRILLEETKDLLSQDGFVVLTHALMPPHDGGLALGQAAIGAIRLMDAQQRA
jgi:hydrogenase maturation protein HypF